MWSFAENICMWDSQVWKWRKFKTWPPYMWLSDPQQEECVIVILLSFAHNLGGICQDPARNKLETLCDFMAGSFMIQTHCLSLVVLCSIAVFFLTLVVKVFFFEIMTYFFKGKWLSNHRELKPVNAPFSQYAFITLFSALNYNDVKEFSLI